MVLYPKDYRREREGLLMLQDYAYITIFGLLGLCFSLVCLAISGPRIFGGSKTKDPGNQEMSAATTTQLGDARQPVESGAPTDNKTWVQFRLRYAVVSLVFISFDMEMVYMFPWGVVFKRLGLVAFGDMFVFIAILAVAILFAWREGAFDWEN